MTPDKISEELIRVGIELNRMAQNHIHKDFLFAMKMAVVKSGKDLIEDLIEESKE